MLVSVIYGCITLHKNLVAKITLYYLIVYLGSRTWALIDNWAFWFRVSRGGDQGVSLLRSHSGENPLPRSLKWLLSFFWAIGLRHHSVLRPRPLHRKAHNMAAMRGQERKVKEMEAKVF